MRFFGENLSCVRGERLVFSGLDFAVEPGTALVLTGSNGSGKTSLLRVMAGLTRPTEGQLAWDDGPISDDPENHHRRLHFVGHLDALKPVLSVHENLDIWARLQGGIEKKIASALKKLMLEGFENIPGRYLSAGQRRRLSLARLAASDAPLWLLDEPTIALDAPSVAAVRSLIAEHRTNGGMAVIATNVDLGIADTTTLNLLDFTASNEDIWEGVT
ncbi:MAG: heme ABC exporter ATP-binding protein CcmA [Alphaproteobacteria bacterium]|nr:heme ABC exporter ATP-binding protein CcmA [Alphaproteobacteria bacterium]